MVKKQKTKAIATKCLRVKREINLSDIKKRN